MVAIIVAAGACEGRTQLFVALVTAPPDPVVVASRVDADQVTGDGPLTACVTLRPSFPSPGGAVVTLLGS
ncbi:Protein of unknown function [Gryllus bimaculatus]|nr:Protein of unknown function [Gryllus bimaculatus]